MAITALPTPPSRQQPEATFATNADNFLGALPTFVTEANALQTDVDAKQATASAAAITATTKAGEALASANASAASASAASGYADAADASAGQAAGSAADAADKYDQFDDRYLGSKAVEPTTDNDGGPLIEGALYWNSSARNMRVWNGSAWLIAYLPATGYVTLTGTETLTNKTLSYANNTLTGVQPALVSGTNIKTIGGASLLGSGDVSLPDQPPIATSLSVIEDSQITLASSLGSISGISVVSLDANRELLVLFGFSSFHAVVYDSSSESFGAPTLLRTAVACKAKAVLVSADKVLVCALPADTTALQSVILSISGTTITVGTAVATTLGSNCSFADTGRLFALGSAFVLEYNNESAVGCLRAITVSGTTPTVGSECVLNGNYGGPSFAVTSSVALCVRASNSQVFAIPVSLSGTTLTKGTQATATASRYQGVCAAVLSSGRYAVTYANSTIYGAIVSVSGTTATMTTVNLGLAVGTATDVAIVAVGSQAIVGATSGVNVLTDNSGTAVSGTAITGTGPAFGYASNALLVNSQSAASRGAYKLIGISGNSPAEVFADSGQFDANYATPSGFPSWRQGNSKLGLYVLRSSAGKHVVVPDAGQPFTLSTLGGENTRRAWGHNVGPNQCFKGESEAYVWMPSLALSAETKIRLCKVVVV